MMLMICLTNLCQLEDLRELMVRCDCDGAVIYQFKLISSYTHLGGGW